MLANIRQRRIQAPLERPVLRLFLDPNHIRLRPLDDVLRRCRRTAELMTRGAFKLIGRALANLRGTVIYDINAPVLVPTTGSKLSGIASLMI